MEPENPFSWTKGLKDPVRVAIPRNKVNLKATKISNRIALSKRNLNLVFKSKKQTKLISTNLLILRSTFYLNIICRK